VLQIPLAHCVLAVHGTQVPDAVSHAFALLKQSIAPRHWTHAPELVLQSGAALLFVAHSDDDMHARHACAVESQTGAVAAVHWLLLAHAGIMSGPTMMHAASHDPMSLGPNPSRPPASHVTALQTGLATHRKEVRSQ